MRIEPHPRSDAFIVHTEDGTERALMGTFLRNRHEQKLALLGSTYECDHSAYTGFCFGWVPLDWGIPKEPKHIDGTDWAEAAFI